jgi:hypothetical protein
LVFQSLGNETKQQNDPSRTQSTFDQRPHLSAGVPLAGSQQIARLHSTYGNQAVLRMLSQSAQPIQTKLTVNQPGDEFEQEADRVADHVMRMTAPAAVQRKCTACEQEERLQRKCAECQEEEKETGLQRKQAGAGPQVAPPSVYAVLNSPGQPLDAATRAFMEPRFGHDFSGVRVHTDAGAADSAKAVNALAYTLREHVVFNSNQYSPGTAEGQRLLAHELTHVVQQRPGSRDPLTIYRQPKGPQPPTCSPPAQQVRQLPADFNTPANVQALAEILWHEMGNQVPESIAVGSIVLNRLLKTQFHKVAQLKSFERKADPPTNVVDLACSLLTGQYADTTNGSENYFSPQSMPDAANAGCCKGQSGSCNIPDSAGKLDCKGGLQAVPGTNPPKQRFFPGWATEDKRQPQPQGTDPMLIQVYKP